MSSPRECVNCSVRCNVHHAQVDGALNLGPRRSSPYDVHKILGTCVMAVDQKLEICLRHKVGEVGDSVSHLWSEIESTVLA